VWWKVTDVLEMITATFIRTTLKSPENIEGTDEKMYGLREPYKPTKEKNVNEGGIIYTYVMR
jgi:hypothetical protein